MQLAAKNLVGKRFEQQIASRLWEKLEMTPTEPYAAKHLPLTIEKLGKLVLTNVSSLLQHSSHNVQLQM